MPMTITPAHNERAARLITLLLVVLIAATAADVTWVLLAPKPSISDNAVPAAVSTGTANRRSGPPDGERLARLHLFGIAQSGQKTAAKPVAAPDTRLRLTLKGVVAHDDPKQARAIVANAGGREDTYSVGQEITGGAVLREVKANHVLLERAGRYETLRLPEKSTGGLSVDIRGRSANTVRSQPTGTLANIAEASLREIRDTLVQNPQVLGQYLRAVPVQQDGQFKGFRVMAGNKTHLLDKLGFRRGDIVTEVNGIAMDSQLKGLEALSAITEADSNLQVTVMRGGKPQVLTFSLD